MSLSPPPATELSFGFRWMQWLYEVYKCSRNNELRVATTAQLTDAADPVNVDGRKVAGYPVYNTTTSKPVWADGAGATDVWVEADGTTEHTPS